MQRCRAILLTYKGYGKLLLNVEGTLYKSVDYPKRNGDTYCQLIIISDEKIKENDWWYNEISKKISNKIRDLIHSESKKIISATNIPNLPIPSEEFIDKYIEYYNSGKRNLEWTCE